MRNTVAIVADDLTGAADTGGAFVTAGLATIVTWSKPVLNGIPFGDPDVLSLDLESRIADRVRAREVTAEVVRAMRERGVEVMYKKCDSMLRGHIGEEVSAALGAWHPSSIAVAALAFPRAGRTTIDGRQYVHGVLLDRPPIAQTLQTAGFTARAVDASMIRQGSFDACLLRTCREKGVNAVVCDAETDEDLRAIARAGAGLGRDVVWVGSGGLARMLPEALGLKRPLAIESIPPIPRGPILFVVGSTSKIARAQAARAIASGAVHVAVPIEVLAREARGDDSGAAIASWVVRECRSGRDVVVTIGELSDVDAPELPLTDRLGDLVRPCAAIAGGIVVAGGDTATGLLRALKTTALRLVDEIEPGVPLAMSVAPRPMPVVTKAGAFGDEDTLVRAAARLRRLFA